MFQENLKVTGAVAIKVFDKDGNVKQEQLIKNLVVASGKSFIAEAMVGTPTQMSHMAVGAGTSAAASGDTNLGSELGRVALDSNTSSGPVVTYVANFPAGTGTGAVTEAGIFNDVTGGVMLCRTVFAVVNKGVDDAMSITWQITVS